MTLDIDQAVCVDADPETFFPDPADHHGVEFAKSYCRRCPVAADCLQYALELDARFGIWGGTTPNQRGHREPGGKRGRPVTATCPSQGAYARHLARGEPTCDACRAFVNERARRRREQNPLRGAS